ncbi:unnamed protein product (macronuclear) [Paramecium tetraurelia]|uniref:Aminopeptidase n=1 Tax=Paramecium tetraurelia TaxID=5888 RepID=A0DTA8_PARTE|nr:uncharacterized protein GSPATT00019968001 [Paramecium tetraurelia]CAK86275.1 unnamed protein product [Paramecium tetraurelia]|eukprot:XP_001453672.1 hypothetical protein (macronuclear) [Paramecium tetraurelia strain d4-2]
MQILKKFTNTKSTKIGLIVALGLSGIALSYHFYDKNNRCCRSAIQTPSLPQNPIENQNEFGQNRFLTQAGAIQRWRQIKEGSISYKVDLLLKRGESYSGLVALDFEVIDNSKDLYVDFKGSKVVSLYVNGNKINDLDWNGLFIRVPKEFLNTSQKNRVNIQFDQNYAKDGCGLHGFIDKDGKQYLYSQCESYFTNRFFPCMDQPDLKAKLRFTAVCPKEWVVISNENADQKEQFNVAQATNTITAYHPQEVVQSQLQNFENSDSYNFWVFGETMTLPTYLFALVAGEYWSIKFQGEEGDTPQTIYCRESLKEHMMGLKDFIFEVTKKSMKFYENFFGVKYQFNKYDSVFVNEYNWGAMENPGCVTFNDVYVFKEKKPATSYTQFANTIAHEMAHHWFGDFVTMKWWNDLWLNESYADFISHFCLQNIQIESIKLSSIPVMFNQRKGWGYREDQMLTTHPIAGEVINTEVAENIFDGITYSKGASVMKQLLCIMGAAKFGEACGNYFRKFGWKNAVLQDLIDHLQEKFDNPEFTLSYWKQQWIETAGMNEIEPQWDQTDRTHQAKLTIFQRPALSQFPALRIHKIKIGLFHDNGLDSIDAVLQATEENVITYDGSKGYRAVLLNFEDQSFVKVLLDQESTKYFSQNLHAVQDILTRTLIYRALFDSVRDGKICSEEYVDFLLAQLPRETSDEILNTQLMFLQGAIGSMTPRKFKKILGKRVFSFLIAELVKISGDAQLENRLILLRNNLVAFAYDNSCVDELVDWFQGQNNNQLQQIECTKDNKWAIVKLVYGSKKYDEQPELREQLLQKMLELDNSDAATRAQLKCQALKANEQERAALWQRFVDPENKESVKLIAESMAGFNNERRYLSLEPYQEKFFEVIVQIFQTRSNDFSKTFFDYLFPITDDLASLCNKIEKLRTTVPENLITLKMQVDKSLDSIKRQVKQFECFCNQAKLATQQVLENDV